MSEARTIRRAAGGRLAAEPAPRVFDGAGRPQPRAEQAPPLNGRLAGGDGSAFTLVEVLVVVSIIALLAGMLVPGFVSARRTARKTICAVNLRHMQTALTLYVQHNAGEFFPYREKVEEGVLWYWGLERAGEGGEGDRPLDKGRARLAPYFSHVGQLETCPEFPYDQPYFKRKYAIASYGYAINRRMLADQSGGRRFDQITRPGETVAWADAVQINTWQAPASPASPMLEEWYYLDNRSTAPATFHFRHLRTCNAVFADSAVRGLQPYWLDGRCDGLVGRPEPAVGPAEVTPLLRLDK